MVPAHSVPPRRPATLQTPFSDLVSPFGHNLAANMFLLGLPRFEDVKTDFFELCRLHGLYDDLKTTFANCPGPQPPMAVARLWESFYRLYKEEGQTVITGVFSRVWGSLPEDREFR